MGALRAGAADVAVSDDPHRLPAHLLDVELLPLARLLVPDQPPEILGEENRRADDKLGQRLAEDATPVSERYRALDELRKQQAVETGATAVHPFHSLRERPELPQHLRRGRQGEDRVGVGRRCPVRLDIVSYSNGRRARQSVKHRELAVGRVG